MTGSSFTVCRDAQARYPLGRVASSVLLALTSCGTTPPVTSKPLPSPIVSHQKDQLDPKLLAEANADSNPEAYQVGAGDSLLVAVYGHPELSMGQYAGAGNLGPRGNGFIIDNDGTIQFPLIGSVYVAGKTVNQLRAQLEDSLRIYVREPKVTVQVLFCGSIRYYLLGQFTDPGLKYADRPMRLLEALALGGSIVMDRASLREAYVARGKQRLPLNFRSLIRDGDLRYNIPLKPGDVIFIPDSASEQAFVFGASTNAGGAVQFVNGRLDVLQALASAGFGLRDRNQVVLSETRVVRSEGDRGELFVVDVERILDGEAANFYLAPGDIVFVPSSALTDWSLALEQLLPSLTTISALLTPFVQIKFLQQD